MGGAPPRRGQAIPGRPQEKLARKRPCLTRDRAHINTAVREAKLRNPNRPAAVYDFIRDLLLKQFDLV